MSQRTRHSKRKRKKAARRAKRKAKQRTKNGQKAGSIAIHSCLPGLVGTELGAMDVVVDTRRKQDHPALITVAIHNNAQKSALVWSIETGFGGQAPRIGYQEVQDGALDQVAPTHWVFKRSSGPTQTTTPAIHPAKAEPAHASPAR